MEGEVAESWMGALRRRPIIAAVRDEDALRNALDSPSAVLFLLSGTLLNIEQMAHRIHREQRAVFVHLDLIDGLSKDQHGVHWLAEKARPTGIISTRGSVLGVARSLGLATVQRVFLLDSQSIRTGLELAHNARPDVVEVLPGILPGVLPGRRLGNDQLRRGVYPCGGQRRPFQSHARLAPRYDPLPVDRRREELSQTMLAIDRMFGFRVASEASARYAEVTHGRSR